MKVFVQGCILVLQLGFLCAAEIKAADVLELQIPQRESAAPYEVPTGQIAPRGFFDCVYAATHCMGHPSQEQKDACFRECGGAWLTKKLANMTGLNDFFDIEDILSIFHHQNVFSNDTSSTSSPPPVDESSAEEKTKESKSIKSVMLRVARQCAGRWTEDNMGTMFFKALRTFKLLPPEGPFDDIICDLLFAAKSQNTSNISVLKLQECDTDKKLVEADDTTTSCKRKVFRGFLKFGVHFDAWIRALTDAGAGSGTDSPAEAKNFGDFFQSEEFFPKFPEDIDDVDVEVEAERFLSVQNSAIHDTIVSLKDCWHNQSTTTCMAGVVLATACGGMCDFSECEVSKAMQNSTAGCRDGVYSSCNALVAGHQKLCGFLVNKMFAQEKDVKAPSCTFKCPSRGAAVKHLSFFASNFLGLGCLISIMLISGVF